MAEAQTFLWNTIINGMAPILLRILYLKSGEGSRRALQSDSVLLLSEATSGPGGRVCSLSQGLDVNRLVRLKNLRHSSFPMLMRRVSPQFVVGPKIGKYSVCAQEHGKLGSSCLNTIY